MRYTSIFAILATLSAPLSGQDSPPADYAPLPEYRVFGAPASDADERAITELMDRFSRAWNAQDVDALMTTYAEDAEWTNAFGSVHRGHGELREMFAWVFERFGAPSKPTAEARAEADEPSGGRGRLSRRYVGSEAAVIHSVTESDWGDNRDGSGLRRVHITYVLEKRAGEWRIGHQMIMDARR